MIRWQQLNPVVLVHEQMKRKTANESILVKQTQAHAGTQLGFKFVAMDDLLKKLNNWKTLDRSICQKETK